MPQKIKCQKCDKKLYLEHLASISIRRKGYRELSAQLVGGVGVHAQHPCFSPLKLKYGFLILLIYKAT